ncbi:unnamed protein product [Notodromas monacha]|uniref:Cyanophycinase n=1 Tax=Notodromas monacha TaxID=399045 RepID=A0A7R9G8L6_9CRUS|nr:unnamed protein product [Notodromas monacha]CAG0913324.1 unnamed protein product [Notodromas monacha]
MIWKIALAVFLLISNNGCNARNNLFLHGGNVNDDDHPVLRRFVDAAGGIGEARIAVITMASEMAVENGEFYTQMFLEIGAADATWIPITMDNSADLADDPEIAAMIRSNTGVFFGGGDQGRIINGIIHPDGSDTLVFEAIRDVFAIGAVGGTSAGTACQSDGFAIAGGRSYEAWANPVCTSNDCGNTDDLSYYPSGLGFAYKIITDSHFGERVREGRLMKLMFEARNPQLYGIGVDESTALLIWDVVGTAGGVTIIDNFAADYDPIAPSAAGVRFTYLTEGDTASLVTGNIEIASWKTNLAGQELHDTALESNDIFSESSGTPGGEFRYVATQLFDSKVRSSTSVTHTKKPQFEVIMIKDANSAGFGGYSPTTSEFVISYANLRVDISAI